jgi:hypothetical protein
MSKAGAIDHYIAMHLAWFEATRSAILNHNLQSLEDAVLRSIEECEFGKWLISEKSREIISKGHEWQKISKLHEEFHVTVADLVQLIKVGDIDDAMKWLDQGGALVAASEHLVKALLAIRQRQP